MQFPTFDAGGRTFVVVPLTVAAAHGIGSDPAAERRRGLLGHVMGARSVRKGKRGEREIAHAFAEALGTDARRGLSQARGGGAEEPDVVVKLPLHIEVKRGKHPNVRAALRQAIADAAEGKTPIAVVRDDRHEAFAVLRLEDLLALLAKVPATEPAS